MKLSAIPLLLAAGVQAQSFAFTNDIPAGASYDVGSDFVLTWNTEDNDNTFQLVLYSNLVSPIFHDGEYDFNRTTTVLNDSAKVSDGSYIWHIEPVDGRAGSGWYYQFGGLVNTAGETDAFTSSFNINT
ncbi:hypothetical protein F4678DRAFT_292252 [Xylaria arbuscula]|nr:hypothetical protein F4678DRAFT_292252 [Xylaria arbuscula]